MIDGLVDKLCPYTESLADKYLSELRSRLAELAPEQRAPFCKRAVDKLQAGVGDTRSFVHSKSTDV